MRDFPSLGSEPESFKKARDHIVEKAPRIKHHWLRLYDTAGCPSISTISVLQCFESPNQSASSIFIDTSNTCDANSITAGAYDR
ncbi:unnamed protein product [Haemonchus placei]|uniref:Transposase n=1 Tax=Haemonchus placei TaxID=6290 RepID=A0A158QPT6_HAEPC|nr:unnamed protein product [Haemonchus placei]